MTDDALPALMAAGRKRHLVELMYHKPDQDRVTVRLVEPYRFEASGDNLLVKCWQVQPEPVGSSGWRNFRLDRIIDVSDAGKRFEPRIRVTLDTAEVVEFEFGHEPEARLTNKQGYFKHLEAALLDRKITHAEMQDALELARPLAIEELRAAHAQIYRNILTEVLLDGVVEHDEVTYLNNVRKFLKSLGWAP